jgi:acetyltransferase-like isoleucine patch superfamily enzyme
VTATPGKHPSWAKRERSSLTRLFGLLAAEIRARSLRYIRYRGNRAEYLRSLGVRIGTDCDIFVSPGNFGSEPWLIEIGDRVTITRDVLLITHDGSSRLFREKYSDSPWGNGFGPIRIHDNSFIGVGTILLPGVTVGPNSIVGAGSVVTRTVPPNTVWAGVPARQVATLAEAEARYEERMVPVTARDRAALRAELTRFFFGEER